QPSPTPCSTAWSIPRTVSSSRENHCANCAPRKPPGLTRRLAPEPNVAALRPYHHPGWLPSECLAGFNRNRWLVSVGIDGWLRRNPHATGHPHGRLGETALSGAAIRQRAYAPGEWAPAGSGKE